MVEHKKLITVFEAQPVRRLWNDKEEKWYFSVVDVVAVLAQNPRPRQYWNDLKRKLLQEGSEVYDKIVHLKMEAPNGKMHPTDAADVETVLRLVQSIPSPKAEPFKLWLARVGYERMQETVDPEMAIGRAHRNWIRMGRDKAWIRQRMLSVRTRNDLTDYWADHEVETPEEFAKLTNVIHKEWSGLTVKEHKKLKQLKTQNLRDHMSNAELLFTALAELSTNEIAEAEKATGYKQNELSAKKGGGISKNARKALEKQTKKRVVTGKNYLQSGKKQKKLR